MPVLLKRRSDSKDGTHGIIELGGRTFHTMEQPDRNNEPFRSCVPLGEYDLLPYKSPKYGPCFIMVNQDLNVYAFEHSPGRPENGRYLCLISHRGNYPHNFQGCVGAGDYYLRDRDMIGAANGGTRRATAELNELIREEGSYRLIIEHWWS